MKRILDNFYYETESANHMLPHKKYFAQFSDLPANFIQIGLTVLEEWDALRLVRATIFAG